VTGLTAAPAARSTTTGGAVVFGVLWTAGLAAIQWSVVRYRPLIVVVLTIVVVALGVWIGRGSRLRITPVVASATIAMGGLVTLVVPLFTYLAGGWRVAAEATLLVGAAACSAALLLRHRWPGIGASVVGAALLAQVVVASIAILGDPAPHIDVWYVLQQASDVLGHGQNIYSAHWTGSPGTADSFPYLPMTAVLLAPGRWLFGDVRWSMTGWFVVGVVGLLGFLKDLSPSRRWLVGAAAALVVFAPGTLTQTEQAWTEPLLFTAVVWWALLVRRGHAWWAVIPLVVACATKQHIVLLLPVAAVWAPFGWRRTVATAAGVGVVVLPWFLASPADFLGDAVIGSAVGRPLRFADTWVIMWLHITGSAPPQLLTLVVVLAATAAAAVFIRRRQPSVDVILRITAWLLLVLNLANKQAFYNQYWLSAALIAASLAAGTPEPESRVDRRTPARTG